MYPDIRDLRIDLFRGLALWMIFTDHIIGNYFSHFTYHAIGYSDAREIFIFLSGISASLAYGKMTRVHGIWWSQFRALYRSVQIYLGYLIVTIASFVIVLSTANMMRSADAGPGEFDLLFTDPARALIAAVSLNYMPGYLDILPVYIAFVALAPLAGEGLRRMPALFLCSSALLWLAAAASVKGSSVPNLVPGGVLDFNPYSWQLLFCIGMFAGEYCYFKEMTFRRIPWLTKACWAVIAGNLLVHLAGTVGGGASPLSAFRAIYDANHALRLQDTEHFLRLTHFLAVAYVVTQYVPAHSFLLRWTWCRPLILCGKFSLETFCLGIVLSMIGSVYFEMVSPGITAQFFANLLGWGLMTGLAVSLAAVRRGDAKSWSRTPRTHLETPAEIPLDRPVRPPARNLFPGMEP